MFNVIYSSKKELEQKIIETKKYLSKLPVDSDVFRETKYSLCNLLNFQSTGYESSILPSSENS